MITKIFNITNNMISKLAKIMTVFGLVAFTGNIAFADGDYMHHNKKVSHKKMVECETKPMIEPACEIAPMPMKKAGLGSGMTFGIGGDFGFAINSNSDFDVASMTVTTPNTATTGVLKSITFGGANFSQKRDNAYGAYANLGWMMDNGLEANIEIGYHQIKNKDKTNSSSHIESDVLSGMINATYYVDLFDGMFLPYVTVGAGIARTEAKGTIYDNLNGSTIAQAITGGTADSTLTSSNSIVFKDLTKTRFAYQAGVGISTSFDSVILGVGYKFFGVSSFSDSNSDAQATLNAGSANPNYPTGSVLSVDATSKLSENFGSLQNNTHNITVFAKFLF